MQCTTNNYTKINDKLFETPFLQHNWFFLMLMTLSQQTLQVMVYSIKHLTVKIKIQSAVTVQQCATIWRKLTGNIIWRIMHTFNIEIMNILYQSVNTFKL